MEQQTYERARLLAAIVDSSFDAIISKTLGGTVTSWNPAAARLFGYQPEEMIGQSIRRLIPAGRQEEEDRILAQIKAGERIDSYETVRLHKNGDPIDVFLTISPIRAPDGTIIGASKILRDITERKMAAESLRKREEVLRQFVDQACAALAMFDRDMRYMACSRRWLNDLGIEDQDLVGRSNYDVFPDLPDHWKEAHRRGMAGEVVSADEDAFVRADGRTQWVSWGVRPWRTGDGSVGGIFIVFEDVTARVEAVRALRESELRTRLAQQAAKAGTWEWCLADNRNRWSENIWDLYGLKHGECTPCFETWSSSIHPEDRERAKKALRGAVAAGRDYETQWRVNLPEGEPERWLMSRGSPVAGANGAPVRYIGVVIDITERKLMEEALRKAEKLERQKRQELEAILAAIPAPVLIAMDASCEDMIGNPAAYELCRLPAGANISKSAPFGTAPANFEVCQNGRRLSPEELPIRKAAAKRSFSMEEVELRFVEGDSKHLLGNALPLFDDAGEVRGAVAAFTDVTGLKRTEAALRKSEVRYRTLVQATSAVTWSCPPSGLHVCPQPEWMAFTGQTAEEMLGDGWTEVVHPDDLAVAGERWADARARGEPFVSEHRIRRRDGAWRWMSVHAAPIRDAGGAIVEWIGMNIDITERKQAEEALQQAEALQRTKREELETILAALPAAVLIANDPSCLDLTGNPAAYELLQRPLGANLSRSASTDAAPGNFEVFQDGRRVAPEDLPLRKAAAKRSFAREEIEIRFADGSSKFLLGNALPLLNEAGEVRGAVAAHADITDLKRTEEALRESEERLRFALEAANAGTWEVDLATGKLVASDRALSFAGFPPGTALTHELALGRTHPDDRVRLNEALRRSVHTGEPYRLEWRALLPDGSIRWLEARGERRSVSESQVIGGLALDITERRRSEEEARAAKTMLEAALAAMTDAVFIYDADGRLIRFNEAFETYHKFRSTDVRPRSFAECSKFLDLYFPNGDLVPIDQWTVPRALRGEKGVQAEYALHRKDTGDLWVGSYNFAPIRGHDGEIIGAVVTARDITDQKAADRRLRESEARLSSIIDTAADSIVVIDEKGIVQSANNSTLGIFGYSPEELIGRRLDILMAPKVADQHHRYLEVFRGRGGVRQVEGLRKDGVKVPIDVAVAEWRDGEGRRFFTGIMRDLTERKKNEEALANARRLEAVGQLAGGVAHDFNNLLSVISGNLEIAQDCIGDETARGFLERARSAAEKGSALNQRLLSLARKRALKPQRLNLNERVQDTAKLLASTVGEHIAVTTKLAANLWSTLADPGEIDSAILNLAANARDAMAGGGNIRISTSNVALDNSAAAELRPDAKPGDYVLLAIADDGPGMPADVLARAFEPFFTTKGPGAGTGLGLASVASFAEQTGGFVTIESAPGQGCAVSVYLPRANKPSPERGVRPSGLPLGHGELVLVVEDDEQVREITVKRLESLGYAVIEAKTGPEAVKQLLSQEPIRLVLSDIVMPGGMTGYDVTRWAAANKPGVKVILCSGYSDGDLMADANGTLDGVPVLGKPYTREQLARAVERALAS
jgi:PAS domain S-box-containing protein